MEYLEWAKANTGLIQATTAVILTLITATYVILTSRLLREAQRQREQSSRPCIVAYVRPHEAHINLLFLCIENTGIGSAHEVEFELDGLSDLPGNVSLDHHGLFKRGVSVMPPRAKTEVFLFSAIGQPEAISDLSGTIAVKYKSDLGKKYKDEYELVFSQLEGYEQIGRPPLYDIAEAAGKLTRAILSWPIKHGRMEVNTHSVEEVESERSTDSIWVRLRQLDPESRKSIEEQITRKLSKEDGPNSDENNR